MVEILKNPLVLDESTDTVYIPKVACLVSLRPHFSSQREFLHYYYHNIIMGKFFGQRRRILSVPTSLVDEFSNLIIENGVKTAEEIWDRHYAKDVSAKTDANTVNQSYKIKESHLTEFYLSLAFSLKTNNTDSPNHSIGVYRWLH